MKASIATLQGQIKDAEDTARADKATREKKLTRLQNNLRVVENNITRAESLIAELSTHTTPSADAGGDRHSN